MVESSDSLHPSMAVSDSSDEVALTSNLTTEVIATRWPRLFHMAEAGSWLAIQRYGLLSTTALLDLFEITGDDRDSIESLQSRVRSYQPS
jgi:hypothetical protein